MEVKLRRTWFYKIDAKPANDQREISGGRYRQGTHIMPDELRSQLPKDAVILSDAPVEPAEDLAEAIAELVDADLDRAAGEAEAAAIAKAEETRQAGIKERRLAALKKAREAKKAKKEAAE